MPDSLRLAAASAHDESCDPTGTYAVVRPKTIGHARHAFSAADLDAACVATGTTTAALARAWGVGETVTRDVRSGKKPLTWDKIKALPASVKEALLLPHLPALSPRDAKIESALVVVLELVRARRGGQ